MSGHTQKPGRGDWRKVLQGFLGLWAVGSPGLGAGAEWLFLSENKRRPCLQVCLCLLHPPGAFCSPPPRLSHRQATLRARASRISGACFSAQTKSREPPGSPKRRKGFALPGAAWPQLPELLGLAWLQKQTPMQMQMALSAVKSGGSISCTDIQVLSPHSLKLIPS